MRSRRHVRPAWWRRGEGSGRMSSYVTVLIQFILPMALLCGGGLLAVSLVRRATPKAAAEQKRPALVSVLVALWALSVGGVLFDLARLAVHVITGEGAGELPTTGASWAWRGVALIATAVLVAACYSLFELRRAAIPLFATYLVLVVCAIAARGLLHPEAAAWWRSRPLVGNVAFGAVTLAYAWRLRSRAVLT